METIGFTGTSDNTTAEQRLSIEQLLISFAEQGAVNLRHGMCVGADAACHVIAQGRGYHTIGHPGVTLRGATYKRAQVECDTTMPAKPFLDRNRDIVDGCELLIAAPKGFTEELRSGTWATVRYARKQRKPIWIVWPDGHAVKDGGN